MLVGLANCQQIYPVHIEVKSLTGMPVGVPVVEDVDVSGMSSTHTVPAFGKAVQMFFTDGATLTPSST